VGHGAPIGPDTRAPHSTAITLVPGIQYIYSDKLALALGVGIGVAGKNTDLAYTPIFSFTYVF
jgi:hypothetical protein